MENSTYELLPYLLAVVVATIGIFVTVICYRLLNNQPKEGRLKKVGRWVNRILDIFSGL